MYKPELTVNSMPVYADYCVKPLHTKIDPYESFWIFFIGSVFGFCIETIWCAATHDHLEYHSSLVSFPFTVVYGCGALVLYLILHEIEKNKTWQIFMLGATACTTVEYLNSYLQEKCFGSVSWDYSATFMNIGGRVCLLLTLIWGMLAILWALALQPLCVSAIHKIPAHIYKPLTLGLALYLVIQAVISIVVVTRWGMRLDGIPPMNGIAAVIDKLFPNEFMARIYPSMRW